VRPALTKRSGIDYALTGAAAVARIAPFVTNVAVAEVWLGGTVDASDVCVRVGATPVESGPNVVFLQERDDGPLAFRTRVGGVWTANLFRLYVDVRREPTPRPRAKRPPSARSDQVLTVRGHYNDYSQPMTLRCERALVTFIGDIGPWSRRVVLVGGLAPRYLVGSVPPGASRHVGTTDVDLVVQLAVEHDFETYATLATNLKDSGFSPGRDSYQWSRQVEGATVSLEFLCETDQVAAGKIHRTKHRTGSRFAAVNIPGAQLGPVNTSLHHIQIVG